MVCPCFFSRERIIPFGNAAKNALDHYLEDARMAIVTDTESEYLFANCSGQPMSRQGFWKLIKQYAKAAGIQQEITPHTLRHSFAAHLVNNGADLGAVSRMMGFADLSAAQIYADMHQVSVREAYKKRIRWNIRQTGQNKIRSRMHLSVHFAA